MSAFTFMVSGSWKIALSMSFGYALALGMVLGNE